MILRAINEGLGIADDTISGLRFLQNKAGLDSRGFIRRAGVMSMIQEYAERGDLPFDATFEKQPRGVWHWLNMTSGGVLGHIVKTEGADIFPKDGPTKQDKRITNQGDFFRGPKLVDFEEILTSEADIYAWLSYGCDTKGNVTHAIWGIPAADDNVYLASANILVSAAQQVDEVPSDPIVEPTFGLAFTEQVSEALAKANEADEGSESSNS